jgi:hypothetical protein
MIKFDVFIMVDVGFQGAVSQDCCEIFQVTFLNLEYWTGPCIFNCASYFVNY